MCRGKIFNLESSRCTEGSTVSHLAPKESINKKIRCCDEAK